MSHIGRAAAPAHGSGGDTIEESLLLAARSGGGARDSSTGAPCSLDSGITWACLASGVLMCLSPLQYGYHIAELNTPRGIITSCDKDAARWLALPLCLPMNDAMFSVATSMFAVGGLVGSLAAGWMAERWGRRGALTYNNAAFVVGPLLMAFAVSPAMLVAGRFVSGIGSGAAVVIAPLYLSEIAPVKLRGTLNLLNQLSIVLGILTTLTVGMLANKGPYWRVSVGFGLLLACLQLSAIAFAVESPRYLWQRNRRAEARNILRTLRQTTNVDAEVSGWQSARSSHHDGCSGVAGRRPQGLAGGDEESEIPSADFVDGMAPLADSIRGSAKPDDEDEVLELHSDHIPVTIFNIFRLAQYRKPWLLVLLLQFGQQLSGINTVFYFSSAVLEKMFSSHTSSILTVMIGVLNVLATASGALIVDRFGRRPLLFSSMAAMAVSVTLLGVGLGLKLNSLAVASLYLIVASFAPGYGPVPFLLGTEFFDVRAAGAGGSWALAANWLGTFIVAAAFLPLQSIIGEWVFAIFVVATVVCGAVFYRQIPETKGRTVEDIAKKFA
ncbi:hypothetical protein H4R26_004842 [Coemansia thaxteri]|uniref:Major facilitator superfamily (MFS) profile domain-containing protein n=1 Tax=Coemansia thaxteri TaxID=2663907 RepID=A0A9W8ED73_9FUNG|nr:hypothetical protein H4R26_004842 [Coemansia thaxteri]